MVQHKDVARHISSVTNQLTNYMEQSPCRDAKRSSCHQEIPRILCNPTFHHHNHKRLPHVRILGHSNPVLVSPTKFLKIHFNITPLCTSRYSKWPLSITSPHQNPVCIFPVTHTCHMSRPSHSSRFDNKLFVM